MKISDVEYEVHRMELSEPYQIAYETVSHCDNITLKLITDSGLVGYGLAAPDKEITNESAEDVVNSITDFITPLLKGEHPFRISYWMRALKENPKIGSSAKAMVDIALHDLLARKARLPLYQLLGGFRESIPTSVTIGIKPLDETLEIARKYFGSGFNIIKLKGGLNLDEDIEKIVKLREILGKKITIRFDANQGYSPQQALEFVKKVQDADVELFEQPTKKDMLESIMKVTQQSSIPIMADESITSLFDTIHLTKNEAIDMINIKLQKVGGILEAGHINSVGKSDDIKVMVGCLDECSLGIAAGLHFALSSPNIFYADLDGHLDIINDPYTGLFSIEKGVMIPNKEPGVGLIQ